MVEKMHVMMDIGPSAPRSMVVGSGPDGGNAGGHYRHQMQETFI